uniref:Uncharacterized protein n=1 Tax=Zea mays TaxID=4577 RepID=A0A804N1E0_MAIZE
MLDAAQDKDASGLKVDQRIFYQSKRRSRFAREISMNPQLMDLQRRRQNVHSSNLPSFVPCPVVIGDFLYELRFRVDKNLEDSNSEPMDMDDLTEDGNGEANNGATAEEKSMYDAKQNRGEKKGGTEQQGISSSKGVKQVLFSATEDV